MNRLRVRLYNGKIAECRWYLFTGEHVRLLREIQRLAENQQIEVYDGTGRFTVSVFRMNLEDKSLRDINPQSSVA